MLLLLLRFVLCDDVCLPLGSIFPLQAIEQLGAQRSCRTRRDYECILECAACVRAAYVRDSYVRNCKLSNAVRRAPQTIPYSGADRECHAGVSTGLEASLCPSAACALPPRACTRCCCWTPDQLPRTPRALLPCAERLVGWRKAGPGCTRRAARSRTERAPNRCGVPPSTTAAELPLLYALRSVSGGATSCAGVSDCARCCVVVVWRRRGQCRVSRDSGLW